MPFIDPAPPPQASRSTVAPQDDAFAPLTPTARRWLTLGPIGGFGLILVVTALLVNPGTAGFLASIAFGTFVGGGKLMILAGAVERAPVGPWALAALIVYVDLATALIALGGMHHLYELPVVGRRLRAARESGWRVLQRNPWMYRITWLSVVAFIAVPFQATGALVGVIIGRLLGLSRLSIIKATVLGSITGSTALALAGDYWEERITAIAERPLFALGAVLLIVGLMMVGSRFVFGGSGPTDRHDSTDTSQRD